MTFEDALVYMKTGERITRLHWEGKALYIAPRENGLGNTIYFSTPKGSEGLYIPCNADLLGNDWSVVKVKQDA